MMLMSPGQRRAIVAPRHSRRMLAQDQLCSSCMGPVTFCKEHCREMSAMYGNSAGLDCAVFLCAECLPFYRDVSQARH